MLAAVICQHDGTDNTYIAVVFALPDSKSAVCQELTVKYGSNIAVSGVRSGFGKSIKKQRKIKPTISLLTSLIMLFGLLRFRRIPQHCS